jgi:hypothetical protein
MKYPCTLIATGATFRAEQARAEEAADAARLTHVFNQRL